MHQNDIIRSRRNRLQSVLHRLLAVLAADHQLDLFLDDVFGFALKPCAKPRNLAFPQSNPNLAHRIDGRKLAQRMDENWRAAQFGELLGGRCLLLSCP